MASGERLNGSGNAIVAGAGESRVRLEIRVDGATAYGERRQKFRKRRAAVRRKKKSVDRICRLEGAKLSGMANILGHEQAREIEAVAVHVHAPLYIQGCVQSAICV